MAERHGLEHQLDLADQGMVIVLVARVVVTHVVGGPAGSEVVAVLSQVVDEVVEPLVIGVLA